MIMDQDIGEIGTMITIIDHQDEGCVSTLLQQRYGNQVIISTIVTYGVQVIMRHVITLNIVRVVNIVLSKSVYYFDF